MTDQHGHPTWPNGTADGAAPRRRWRGIAAALVLAGGLAAMSAGLGTFDDHGGDLAAIATSEQPADLAALLGPWRPAPIAIPQGLWTTVEGACREDWRRGDLAFGRDHRGPDFVAALVDARGDRRLIMAFRNAGWQVAFCTVMLTIDGRVPSAEIATFGGGGSLTVGPEQVIVGPSWSDGSGEPGRPITDSGPIGLAGEAIRAAVVESRGHPRVLLTVANGLWAFWVPWDWQMFDPTLVAFDSMGLEVAREALR